LRGRCCEEEERKEEEEAPTGGVERSVREREGERERAELATEGGGVRELGRAWEGEKWAAGGLGCWLDCFSISLSFFFFKIKLKPIEFK
jgi:hypothetical protein